MTQTFRRVAARAAVLTAIVGVFYTVTFALFVRESYHWAHWASALALMTGGLVATPVMVGLYATFREQEPEFALIGLAVGLVGSFGAAIHGGFDVAVLANPVTGSPDLPSEVDPRGLLTFAFAGAALGLFGWLALRTRLLPAQCGYAGLGAWIVLLVVYLGRLIELDPNTNVIRVAALAAGIAFVPAFYLQAGRVFARPVASRR
jgi:hypothetical protein